MKYFKKSFLYVSDVVDYANTVIDEGKELVTITREDNLFWGIFLDRGAIPYRYSVTEEELVGFNGYDNPSAEADWAEYWNR